MNAQKALELLQPIPAEEFIVGRFTDENNKCCAIGHLIRLTSDNPDNYQLDNCSPRVSTDVAEFTRRDTANFLKRKYGLHFADIATVNNYRNVNNYTQEEPKDRVIALLQDMIEEGH